jgi:ubiquinone/menaquinone biosynthesis C-methylase UbiE
VLDVGCGTGSLAVTLAEDYACKVWGVDASAEMLDVARAKVPPGIGLKLGRAEALPFKDGWFERAVATLAIHLWDRPRAFAEVARVVEQGGRFALASFNPAHFAAYYLNAYFPSILAIDTARFAPATVLAVELADAGFTDTRTASLTQQLSISREAALSRIRGRHISTFQLIPGDEYAEGLARAERELPERVDFVQHWLVVSATSPGTRAAPSA